MKARGRTYCILSVVLIVLVVLCSCTNDECPEIIELTYNSSGCVKAKVNANRICFNTKSGTTRASEQLTTVWNDSAIIYLLFTRANGTTTTGQAVYSEDNDEWTVTYKQPLIKDELASCIAFYIDGGTGASGTNLELRPQNALYTDSTATYIYPTGGTLTIKCLLKPTTGRVRFAGETSTGIEIQGLKYISSFNTEDHTYTMSNVESIVSVGNDGYTPYLYCCMNSDKLSISYLSEDFYLLTFSTDYSDTNILKKGKSGFMSIPTLNNHNGWELKKDNLNGKFVDLGLPSGTIWMAYNLGSPDNLVYAWGEIQGYKYYENGSWSEYKHCNGSNTTLTKYNYNPSYGIVDNKNELELEDDAAYQFNPHYRIPSVDEFDELLQCCRWSKGVLIGPNSKELKFDMQSYWEREGGGQLAWCVDYGIYTYNAWIQTERCNRLHIRPILRIKKSTK